MDALNPKSALGAQRNERMTPREERMSIIAACAAEFGISCELMMSRSRIKRVAKPRQEAMRRVKAAFPKMSAEQIGRLFDRDHTTVLHALGLPKLEGIPHVPRERRPAQFPRLARAIRADFTQILTREGWPAHHIANVLSIEKRHIAHINRNGLKAQQKAA